MDSHYSKLRDSLIEICVVVGMDEHTGLVQALSPEVSSALFGWFGGWRLLKAL